MLLESCCRVGVTDRMVQAGGGLEWQAMGNSEVNRLSQFGFIGIGVGGNAASTELGP